MSIHLGGMAAQFRLVRRFIDECPDDGRRWRRRKFGRRLTTRRLALSGAGRARFISLGVVGLPRRSPVGHHLAILCCRISGGVSAVVRHHSGYLILESGGPSLEPPSGGS